MIFVQRAECLVDDKRPDFPTTRTAVDNCRDRHGYPRLLSRAELFIQPIAGGWLLPVDEYQVLFNATGAQWVAQTNLETISGSPQDGICQPAYLLLDALYDPMLNRPVRPEQARQVGQDVLTMIGLQRILHQLLCMRLIGFELSLGLQGIIPAPLRELKPHRGIRPSFPRFLQQDTVRFWNGLEALEEF
jgi:hypothetical protein